MTPLYPYGTETLHPWTTYHQTAAAQMAQNGPINATQLYNVIMFGRLLNLHPQSTGGR